MRFRNTEKSLNWFQVWNLSAKKKTIKLNKKINMSYNLNSKLELLERISTSLDPNFCSLSLNRCFLPPRDLRYSRQKYERLSATCQSLTEAFANRSIPCSESNLDITNYDKITGISEQSDIPIPHGLRPEKILLNMYYGHLCAEVRLEIDHNLFDKIALTAL